MEFEEHFSDEELTQINLKLAKYLRLTVQEPLRSGQREVRFFNPHTGHVHSFDASRYHNDCHELLLACPITIGRKVTGDGLTMNVQLEGRGKCYVTSTDEEFKDAVMRLALTHFESREQDLIIAVTLKVKQKNHLTPEQVYKAIKNTEGFGEITQNEIVDILNKISI